VWTPTRTCTGAVDGHCSLATAWWIAAAAFSASEGWMKTENVESPSPLALTNSPPDALTASRMIVSWRATALDIAVGSRSHSETESTMSVSRKVRGYQLSTPRADTRCVGPDPVR
jgi:hypothetical protein